MRCGPSLCLMLTGLLLACGDDIPPARYDTFTLELLELAEGQRVFPGTALAYRVEYAGDLARNLQFTAYFTHEASGATDSFSWSDNLQDTARIDLRSRWFLRHEFLKKAGRIRVQLQASLTSTKRGSTPWTVQSESVYVELYPRLERLEVTLPGGTQPVPYGTPVEVRVSGKDLWGDVEVTVLDVGAGTFLPELAHVLPFDGSQEVLGGSRVLRARQLERVGTHPLRLVARYGDLTLESEPLDVQVTHTLDEVTVLVRDAAGGLAPSSVPYPRLSQVSGLGLRISGTQLAGHTLTVNGGTPVTAGADSLDLMVATPKAGDFEGGKGREEYTFLVRSGGIERTASLTLQRWGIERCGWRSPEGRPLGESEAVNVGSPVQLHAELWGFPDTSGWFLFKSPMARFTVWERDPGGRPTPEEIDSLKNNDDEGDSLDAEVRSSASQATWATVYEDEFDPLDLHVNAAEYYFEVQVEDQVCTSGQILVW